MLLKYLEIDEYGNFEKIPESASFNSRFPFPVQHSYILPGVGTVPAVRAAGPRSGPQGSEAVG